MPIEKPLPLMVGNKAYYTLTSYDPVEITVEVPYVTEEDVAMAMQMTVTQLGGTMASLDDPAWVAERFEGLTTRAQVEDVIRYQVKSMNEHMAEEQKLSRCVEALSARLAQSIPPQHLEEARHAVQAHFTESLQAEGMTPQQFMARTGTTPAQLESMFDRQARQMAEGEAALSAFAHQRKLKVDEHEFAQLLGLPPEQADEIIAHVKASGQFDDMREAALRSKAAQIVVAECSCSYQHESPEKARLRVAQYRQMQQMLGDEEDDEPSEPAAPTEGRTGFKLV